MLFMFRIWFFKFYSYWFYSHRLDWPVRTLSFSHDGKMLASASEDHFIDVAEVETGEQRYMLKWSLKLVLCTCITNWFVCVLSVGEKLWEIQCESPTFTVAWHPKRPLLAYACDDKEGKYDSNREAGTVKLFGLPNDSWGSVLWWAVLVYLFKFIYALFGG